MIPLLKDQGLGCSWEPLAGGFLSGEFTRDSGDEAARRAVRLSAGQQGKSSTFSTSRR
jgi:aryl-alcohol dehydrogenase-like predicted oxidoreductase